MHTCHLFIERTALHHTYPLDRKRLLSVLIRRSTKHITTCVVEMLQGYFATKIPFSTKKQEWKHSSLHICSNFKDDNLGSTYCSSDTLNISRIYIVPVIHFRHAILYQLVTTDPYKNTSPFETSKYVSLLEWPSLSQDCARRSERTHCCHILPYDTVQ